MRSVTLYSEAGGIGKTTLAANVAVAAARSDTDTLVVDMDPQDADLSRLFGVDDDRADPDVDHLARHMIGNPRGSLDDLVRTVEGVDVIPAHNELGRLNELLREAEDYHDEFEPVDQLRRVLGQWDQIGDYDLLLVDPPGGADQKLYNAISATRTLVVPFEPSGKGLESINGLSDMVAGVEQRIGADVGVLAVVPVGYKGTNDQERAVGEVREMGYDVPVVIRERSSLFQGCWTENCSAFQYLNDHRSPRDYELETLQKITDLAEFVVRGGPA